MPGRMMLLLPVLLAFLSGCQFIGFVNPPHGIIDPPNIAVEVDADSVLFAVIGDYGRAGDIEEAVASLVKGWDPDFILTTGDNNYGYGEYATLYQNIGQYYCDYIYNFDAPDEYRCDGNARAEELNRFFPSPGNHDELGPFGLEPYLNYFTLPGEELFYTFSWGDVAFYSINSLFSADLEAQQAWLKDELERSDKAFQVVYFHHPPFTPGPHGDTDYMKWDFHLWGVDVVLSGHDHIYARMEHPDEEGLHYIVNGVGGNSLYSCDEDYTEEGISLLSCFDSNYGAMRCYADSTRLIMEFYSIDNPSQPLDRLVVLSEAP
jgi:tartrate-resistant acid phosphatase type 5